jgi:DNA-directed RNA polymerase sigma subunit (sigma70/sigma32)
MLKARRSKRLDKKLADSLPSADDVMIDLETFTWNAALRAALAELSPRDQQLVSMLSSDPPHSFAEISAELGIPVESISQERARCYAQMRRHPAVAALTNTEAGEPGRYSRAEDGADS